MLAKTELAARQTKRTTGSSNNTEYFLSGEATTFKFIAHHRWKRPCRKREHDIGVHIHADVNVKKLHTKYFLSLWWNKQPETSA